LIVGDGDLLSSQLAHQGYSVDTAGDACDALAKLRDAHYDLVLLEQIVPGMSGLDLLRLLRATYSPSDLPVIMVTPPDPDAPVLDALSHGVNDYVTRPVNMPVVAARIDAQLSRSKQERENRESEQRLDPVTGLGNRLLLLERLAHAIQTNAEPVTILLLDLDGFKVVNDCFGHSAGDAVLREAGGRLQSTVRTGDLVAHMGGDEFAILPRDPLNAEIATHLAQRILAELSRPFMIGGRSVSIGASVGIVAGVCGSAEDLLLDADLAMYRAKELGKNRSQLYDPEMRDRARTRMLLAQDLRDAIANGELVAHYQPKVELRTGRIIGFETLMRWQHPEKGMICPAQFIPLAEETGLIIPIGEWILRESCRQLRQWQDRFPMSPPLTMNVNLSVKQLADPGLVDGVRGVLEETGIPAESLKLELTETALMFDFDRAKSVLTALQSMNVSLKLDDFGTGYSSLAYLRALHFDSLKIDRSFVAKMILDPESRIIVETIVKLAHALDMTVVAEGIEERAQADALIAIGCDIGQGFYFSRPVDAQHAEAQLSSAR
jgi:diguanylate cyclase (GGDEF)-like protein